MTTHDETIETTNVFNFKRFRTTVAKYIFYETNEKKKKAKRFDSIPEMIRLLLSLATSVSLSTKLKGVSDKALTNYGDKHHQIKADIAFTFQNHSEQEIADNYKYGIGYNIPDDIEQQLATALLALVDNSSNLDQAFKAECHQIDCKISFHLLFSKLLKKAVLMTSAELKEYETGLSGEICRKQKAHTNLHHVTPPSPWFTGRAREAEQIFEYFSNGVEIVNVTGLGGMGKTQLARYYIEVYANEYTDIYWVDAERMTEEIVLQYSDFLEESDVSTKDKRPNVVRHLFFEHLKHKGKWLLVFDNADFTRNDTANVFIEQCLPTELINGHILITSRGYRPIRKSRELPLQVFSEDSDDAALFVMNRSGDEAIENARELAKRLGYYPLALEIASAFIAASSSYTIEEYLRLLNRDIHCLDLAHEITDYNLTIKTIVQTTLAQMKQNEDNKQITAVVDSFLLLCAFLPHNHINPVRAVQWLIVLPIFPYYFEEQDKEFYRKWGNEMKALKQVCSSELNLIELSNMMVRYGLLTVEAKKNGCYSMHPLLQEILRQNIDTIIAQIAILRDICFSFGGIRPGEDDEEKTEKLYIQQYVLSLEIQLLEGIASSKTDKLSINQTMQEQLFTSMRYHTWLLEYWEDHCKEDSIEYAEAEQKCREDLDAAVEYFNKSINNSHSESLQSILDWFLEVSWMFAQHMLIWGRFNEAFMVFRNMLTAMQAVANMVGVQYIFKGFGDKTKKQRHTIRFIIEIRVLIAAALLYETQSEEVLSCLAELESIISLAEISQIFDALFLSEFLQTIQAYRCDDIFMLPEGIRVAAACQFEGDSFFNSPEHPENWYTNQRIDKEKHNQQVRNDNAEADNRGG